jgi:hypothetical protein
VAKHRLDRDDDGIDWPTTDPDQDQPQGAPNKWFESDD